MGFNLLKMFAGPKKKVEMMLEELDSNTEHDYTKQLQELMEDNKLTTVKWLAAAGMCGLCGLVVGVFAFYMMPFIVFSDRYLQLLPNFSKGNFFYCLVSVGVINVTIQVSGVIVSLAHAYQPTNRSLRFAAYSFTGWLAAIILVSLICLLLCFSISYCFESIFKVGLLSTMLKYKGDEKNKEIMDILQSEKQCCGNQNYTDWFNVDYTDYLHGTDIGVPSSCCNRNVSECRHVSSFMLEHRLTPWKVGCYTILMDQIHFMMMMCKVMLSIIVLMGGAILFFTANLSIADDVYDDIAIFNAERELSKKFRKERADKHELKEYLAMMVESAKAKEEEKKKKLIEEQELKKDKKLKEMKEKFDDNTKKEPLPLDVQIAQNYGIPIGMTDHVQLRGRYVPYFMQGPLATPGTSPARTMPPQMRNPHMMMMHRPVMPPPMNVRGAMVPQTRGPAPMVRPPFPGAPMMRPSVPGSGEALKK